ncbi:MAG: FISUMP domain-containing protein [Ignavibacteriaceae bacterium]|nr:FISUMP domain-containing protein [Ignavibacteriaceae bacterium]
MKIIIPFIVIFLYIQNVAYSQPAFPVEKTKSVITSGSQNTSSLNLTVTALIEALYVAGKTSMSLSPTITVELHDATSKAGIESRIGSLSTAGVGTFSFTSAVNGTPYYIVIKSVNTVETWSANPQSFTAGSLSYDFTTGVSKAYTDGSNPPMALHNGKWCIYSGDLNQDGFVSGDDFTGVDNDNTLFNYHPINDLNGDGFISGDDDTFIDNNNSAFIGKQIPPGVPSNTITYSGQTYNTVLIGTQWWLKENLNVGARINGTQNQSNNGNIEKYCYNDSLINCSRYGGLYQWNEAMQYVTTEKAQGVCPSGWHIPSNSEITTLVTNVGSDGNELKAVGQGGGLGSGTNISGFSALLSGSSASDGSFSDVANYGYFWSSTQYNITLSRLMTLDTFDNNIGQGQSNNANGFSVRCLKN